MIAARIILALVACALAGCSTFALDVSVDTITGHAKISVKTTDGI